MCNLSVSIACACMNVYPYMFDIIPCVYVPQYMCSSIISSICGMFVNMIFAWCLVYIVYSMKKRYFYYSVNIV